MKKLTAIEAVEAAKKYADVQTTDKLSIRLDGELYEIDFISCFLHYTAYIDSVTGEVCGFICEPAEAIEEYFCPAANVAFISSLSA